MKSNIAEIASLKYDAPYRDTFIHRSYIGLDENGILDYCQSRASATWVFLFSSCPYKYVKSKCLYSGHEYPYPLNKYDSTELSVGYWK